MFPGNSYDLMYAYHTDSIHAIHLENMVILIGLHDDHVHSKISSPLK